MTFLEFVDRAEHLIGAFRTGALTQDELRIALAKTDLDCPAMGHTRLDILFSVKGETDSD